MNYVDVYGFGSFFSESILFKDIDLLLVHTDRSKNSCIFAIECKRKFHVAIENLHITMLSKQAERSFLFLEKIQAQYLGRVEECARNENIEKILLSIRTRADAHVRDGII